MGRGGGSRGWVGRGLGSGVGWVGGGGSMGWVGRDGGPGVGCRVVEFMGSGM